MEGTAGTLLALLAYHERFGGSAVLDRARACGDHLLAARSDIAGYQTWRTKEDGAALTGFAHGSSGIAYALARLAAATGESRYEEATREALEFESSLYDAAEANWARSNRAAVAVEQQENTQSETRTVHDSSGNSPRQFAYADRWCHGRTGMGLARVAIAEQLDDRALLEEATTALSATATAEPSHLDNVCCGNAGRIEALLVGSQRAGIDQREAAELAGRCLARRRDGGTLSLQGHGESGVNPTFFDGVAGFAYTLLRLRDPESLPCVLLLE
jgi:lantibiotic modifying enzyme